MILTNIRRLFCTHSFVNHFVSVHESRVRTFDGVAFITQHTSTLGSNMRRCTKCGLMEYSDD